jgi:hypothetical protein
MLKLTHSLANPRAIVGCVCRFLTLSLAFATAAGQSAQAAGSTKLMTILAQTPTTTPAEPAAETSWAILDWAIVVVLIGGALFAICRSSRRN